MSGPWIQTWRGHAVDLLEPRVETIDLLDIAHALSLLCRYTGHVGKLYSVAEHSVRVSWICEAEGPDCARMGLLHDAAEAYTGDLSAPMKAALRTMDERHIDPFGAIEEGIDDAIYTRFASCFSARALGHPTLAQHHKAVKRADLVMLATEARALLGPPPRPWESIADVEPLEGAAGRIEAWTAKVAEQQFLARAAELGIR